MLSREDDDEAAEPGGRNLERLGLLRRSRTAVTHVSLTIVDDAEQAAGAELAESRAPAAALDPHDPAAISRLAAVLMQRLQ